MEGRGQRGTKLLFDGVCDKTELETDAQSFPPLAQWSSGWAENAFWSNKNVVCSVLRSVGFESQTLGNITQTWGILISAIQPF
jgi:hypothetical protein